MNPPTALIPLAPADTTEAGPAAEPARATTNPPSTPVPVTGAQSVVRSLEALDVEIAFGIPGGAILPVYDPLLDSPQVRHVLVRHEQGGGHAATGYAQATGKVGVCMATSGPGATNLVTALADAQMDSVPVVAITGQVGRPLIGTDAFQEIDICGVTMPITKHNMLVTDPAEIPKALADAFHIAATGRPGVVLVDIPKDVLQARTTFTWPPERRLPGYRVITRPHPRPIRAAADLIAAAERPVLYVGGGVIKSGAAPKLRELVELTGIPVVTTLMARGAFPDSHRLHYGMPGMHGTVAAVAALQRSDLLIALGARFDDRVTGEPTSFAPHARVIHVDIDPAEIGKNRHVDIPVVGDCNNVIEALADQIRIDRTESSPKHLASWHDELDRIRDSYPLGYTRPSTGALAPERVIEAIGQAAGPEAIYVAGVGQHQMWAAHFISYDQPRSWLNSGGLGTMGYAVPAALGAKLGAPEREVWAIDGDGCFQMTNQELATAAIEGVPIKIAIINNGNLGMVRQLQHVHYQGRYSNVDLATHTRRIPDFVLLGEALGCVALRCDHEADLEATIARARAIHDRPVVIDFIVDDTALVWPMIAAGASNNHIMLAEGIRPLFDESD
ncbi:acetolactate synthase large subunit [Rhodococcus rhodochrous]|uniref:acetolactate synthase large subunit n=1 Tax=Rhodococcus rhodochrous TaxID=1829 RepID=UPI0027E0DA9B|nr:acetolactate synthase large subunit [Rhodococcus rhodochrous]